MNFTENVLQRCKPEVIKEKIVSKKFLQGYDALKN